MREAKVRRKFAPLWEKQTLFLIRSSAKAGRVRLTNTKSRHARIEDDEWALGARSAYKKVIDLYPEYHWDLDVIIPKTREEVIRRFS
ncbi:MAG: hypothetical protein K6F53_10035 [Lachnospiraceae bacterium]|nr:hypothetical protein [Lachnospiraceae bacterium]